MKKWQEDNAVLKTAIVSRIEEKNKVVSEKYKNVFYMKNDGCDDTLCIHWKRISFNVGDEITCKGRFNKDGTMLCWECWIDKRANSV